MLELFLPFANVQSVNATLLDAWRWCYADLKSPTTRGNFAEYLVYLALSSDQTIANNYKARKDWDVVDLTYGRGIPNVLDSFQPHCHSTRFGWGIEVKSTSSSSKKVSFDLEARQGHVWNNCVSRRNGQPIQIYRRWSDFFILAHFKDDERETQDICDLNNWEFFIIPTWEISQDSITLGSVKRKYAAVSFSQLKVSLDRLIGRDILLGDIKAYKLKNDLAKKMYCTGAVKKAQKMWCLRTAKQCRKRKSATSRRRVGA